MWDKHLCFTCLPSMQQAPIEKRKQLTAIRKEVGNTDDKSGSPGVTGKSWPPKCMCSTIKMLFFLLSNNKTMLLRIILLVSACTSLYQWKTHVWTILFVQPHLFITCAPSILRTAALVKMSANMTFQLRFRWNIVNIHLANSWTSVGSFRA